MGTMMIEVKEDQFVISFFHFFENSSLLPWPILHHIVSQG